MVGAQLELCSRRDAWEHWVQRPCIVRFTHDRFPMWLANSGGLIPFFSRCMQVRFIGFTSSRIKKGGENCTWTRKPNQIRRFTFSRIDVATDLQRHGTISRQSDLPHLHITQGINLFGQLGPQMWHLWENLQAKAVDVNHSPMIRDPKTFVWCHIVLLFDGGETHVITVRQFIFILTPIIDLVTRPRHKETLACQFN